MPLRRNGKYCLSRRPDRVNGRRDMTIFFADNAFIVIFVRFKAIAAADRPTPLERDSTRPNDTNSRRDKEPVRSGYEHGDKAATTCMRTALHTPKRLLTVVLLLLAAAVEAQTLTVGTYNMRTQRQRGRCPQRKRLAETLPRNMRAGRVDRLRHIRRAGDQEEPTRRPAGRTARIRLCRCGA